MKNKYEHLPIEEQIKKYRKENKITLIFGIVWNIIVLLVAILVVYDLDKLAAISCIATIPMSLGIGYYIPKKANDEKIQELLRKLKSESNE